MKRLIILLMFLITMSSAFAQTTATYQNIVLPSDGFKYNVKRIGEGIVGVFQFSA